MKVQNIPQVHQQPSVETLVGNQKQEYPKPSIPVESPQDRPSTQPVHEYNGRVNEAQNTLEANAKNEVQDRKEAEQNETQSLNSAQTLALKANTTQNKIDAYKAGAGVESESEKSYLHLSNTQDRMDAQKELQTIQESYKQKQGHQAYALQMGAMS